MNTKFMLTFDNRVYAELKKTADNRGVSVHELLRAIVVPYWMKHDNGSGEEPFPRRRTRPQRILVSQR